MDDSRYFSPAADRIVRRFPSAAQAPAALPPAFRPLRLLLRPGGLCLELVQPDIVLGRHSGSDVRIPLPDVSRHHCRFVFADGQWEVLDLDSLNGIYVNGERLAVSVLCAGDILRIGGLVFDVEIPGDVRLAGEKSGEADGSAAFLERIARILPHPRPDETQEYRKAS